MVCELMTWQNRTNQQIYKEYKYKSVYANIFNFFKCISANKTCNI